MKLLILGGTLFVGRHLVEAALARGHEVTLFNRGLSNAGLFPEVEQLRGDRGGDLSALKGRRWDALIDTCGYLPHHVETSARLLADAVDYYTFISTLSVYPESSRPGIDESAPVMTLKPEQASALSKVKTMSPAMGGKYRALYGPLKVLCERAVEQFMPGRALIVRAGLIVGPYEYRDGVTYWISRAAHGGEMLAPGRPGRPVQFIDARDLALWIIRMMETRRMGTFNATGPEHALTMQQFLRECIETCASDARPVWVSNRFLIDSGVDDLPMWHPEEEKRIGLASVNCDRALAAGLTFRPLGETLLDTYNWDCSRPTQTARRGLQPAQESQLLEAWRNQSQVTLIQNAALR